MSQHTSNGHSPIYPGSRDPIAIVGIGCRYPGGANSPAAFWRLLYDGVDAIAEIPQGRFDADAYYDPQPRTAGKIVTRKGGFLEKVHLFDAQFFGISPREARCMDPQQRLLLEVAWEALEDGGHLPSQLAGSRTGVFIGMWTNEYEDIMYNASDDIDLYVTTGGGRYAASGRLSYFFDLRGPSITVDSACSSSLVAVHLACRSLWSGESSLALAGGVNLILEPQITIGYSRSGMLSPNAHCKFGDVGADGYVRSEGAGIVVLKPLSHALAANDPIYALIRGSAVNHDGRSSGLLVAPGVDAQAAMLREAYRDAGVSPGAVTFVEAHGTGTKAGDPTELQALGTVLAEGRNPQQPCIIGSVKTNIGHTEAASGLAGLIKVALSLKHGTIPASLNLDEPNPAIPWAELPLRIEQRQVAWPTSQSPAVAGVNSFGVTGTNAHVVLQAAPAPEPTQETAADPSDRHFLLPLSAHTPAALHTLAESYRQFLSSAEAAAIPLRDLGYTLARCRTHHEHRLSLAATDRQAAIRQLNTYLEGASEAGVTWSRDGAEPARKIVFVFPGQGSQWVGMGRRLMAQEPLFRHMLEQCEAAMRPYVTWSLAEQVSLDEGAPGWRMDEIDVIQPTLLSIEIALATLWRAWGVEPSAVIGHSMGEVAAAFCAGALTLDEAMCVICRRSGLLRRTSGQGAMAVVELSIEEAQQALAGYEDRLSIAVSNSLRSTVLSGEPAALHEVIETFQQQDVFCRLVKVDVASHSPQMDSLRDDLVAALRGLHPSAGSVPIYSTALSAVIDGSGCDATYWAANLRQPVLFSKMVQQLLADDHTAFIEMSPHPILLPAVQQGMQHAGMEGIVLPSLRRDEEEQATLLNSLGALFVAGGNVAWERLYPNGRRCVGLPIYPWQRERFWYDAPARQETARSRRRGGHPLLGQPVQTATGAFLWEIELSLKSTPYLADHRVRDRAVFPAAAYLEMVGAAASEAYGEGTHTPANIKLHEALFLPSEGTITVQLIFTPALLGSVTFQFFSRPPASGDGQPWQLHATGTVLLNQIAETPTLSAPGGIVPELHETLLPADEHYRRMAGRGLAYGAHFQTVAQLWRMAEPERVVGKLHTQDAAASRYHLYPPLLDAGLQLLIATVAQDGCEAKALYLPHEIDRVQVYGKLDPSAPLWAYALGRQEGDTLSGEVSLVDESGQVLVQLDGVRMHRLDAVPDTEIEEWLYEVEWQLSEPPKPEARRDDEPGTWLIFADSQGVGADLASRLAAAGKTPLLIYAAESYRHLDSGAFQINPARSADYAELLNTVLQGQTPGGATFCQGIVHLWSLDAADTPSLDPAALQKAQAQGAIAMMHLVQGLSRLDLYASPALWLVTQGSQAVETPIRTGGVLQSPLWGLGGVIAHEHPELHCGRIDLSPPAAGGSVPQTELDALWAELRSDAGEGQIVLRGQKRFAARLQRYSGPSLFEGSPDQEQARSQPVENYCLTMATPGVLDGLQVGGCRRSAPGPGQVEIEVRAAGLNFIDVMKAMGIYPGVDPTQEVALGGECAGKISAVGEGVEQFAVGDEVIALNPSFDTDTFFSAYVTIPVEVVARKPAHLSFEEAAAIPVCFLTAYYSMQRLGRLQKGERVLIHSATGGVGLAAIQVAQLAEAEVFATAGTPQKRAYLREIGIDHVMDSRSLAFASEVRKHSDGRGVDMVLNSLTGEALQESFAALAPYGRFLEIGKRDIYQNSRLGMEPFRHNLAFFAVDLARMAAERPALLGAMLRELVDHFEQNRLHPLPVTSFPLAEAAEAFRRMAQAKHLGKLVISMTERPPAVSVPVSRPAAVRADATYLITGGLGGVGLTVAQWLADEGARHLVLLGRNAASPSAQATIDRLVAEGVKITVAQADVTQPDDIAGVLHLIETTLPPLRGVFHAAGTLDDATLLRLDEAKFRRVTAPKIEGGWNLHVLTQRFPLDLFVLFSSATVWLGSPGQGNYVAANAFLDALAHHRRSLGLPSLSVNWGPWAEVGLAAAQVDRGERLAARGVGSIAPHQAVAALARLLQHGATQAGVMPFDPDQWCDATPTAKRSHFFDGLFDDLSTDVGTGSPQPQAPDLRHTLAAAEPGRQRRSILEDHLRDQVARVLRLAASRIPINRPLKGLGMDSLMALELRNRLEASLRLTLSATMVFNYPTIEQLTGHLAERMGVPLAGHGPIHTETGSEDGPSDDPGQDYDGLSEDEVQSLLAEELATIDDLLKEI